MISLHNVVFTAIALAIASGEVFIAGIDPSERPKSAPVISEQTKGPGWYADALTGITQPYPYSLRFLENQGNWHTPFNRPGMTGPYDIRSWHEHSEAEGN